MTTLAKSAASILNIWIEPHNDLFQRTLKAGVIGEIIILRLLFSLFHKVLRLGRAEGLISRFEHGFAVYSIASWLCGIANSPFFGFFRAVMPVPERNRNKRELKLKIVLKMNTFMPIKLAM